MASVLRILCLVLFGQVLAVLLALTGAISKLLVQRGFRLPVAQSFLNYVLLMAVYSGLSHRKQRRPLLSQFAWYKLALIAFADVQANFCVIKAFQLTDVLSVQLLSLSAIPLVMVTSVAVLRVRFTTGQYFGAALCVAGLCVLVCGDSRGLQAPTKWNPKLLGDALCVLSGVCYAVSNVGAEFALKLSPTDDVPCLDVGPLAARESEVLTLLPGRLHCCRPHNNHLHPHPHSWHRSAYHFEYLRWLGTFGAGITLLQASLVERQGLLEFSWDGSLGLLVGAFTLALFAVYSLIPAFLYWSSATFVNLSVVFSNFYMVVFRQLWLHSSATSLDGIPSSYVLSLGMATLGILWYSLATEVGTPT